MNSISNNPRMEKSIVCFVDILGFSNMIKESCENGNGDYLLLKLHTTLNNHLHYLTSKNNISKKLKIFTDNIVIGAKMNNKDCIMNFLKDICYYQLALTLEGLFIRGGISIGNNYMDDHIVFGPAIIEAHELENAYANNPRIIIDNNTYKNIEDTFCLNQESTYFDNGIFLLKDSDGYWFLNYLILAVMYYHLEFFDLSDLWMQTHRNQITQKIILHKNNSNILSKYIWTANYHNLICKNYFPWSDKYLVDLDNL